MIFKNPFKKKSVFILLLRTKSGFTLIETVIAAVLVGLVFAAGIAAMLPLMRFLNIEQSETRAEDDATIALEWIKKDAIAADSINTITPNQLVLTVTNYASTVRPFPSDTITYSVTDTALSRGHTAESTRTITNIIDTANLPTYSDINSANCLEVNIYTKDTAPDPDIEAHQRGNIMLRCRRTAP